MPNWCDGNIRFRGKQENIKRFLMNEIVCCRMKDHETVEEKAVVEDKSYCMILTKPAESSWFYIKGTRRNFFECDAIEVWFEDDEKPDKDIIVCIDKYRVAWSFHQHERWVELAKEYDFDVKQVGYERGMEFSQIKTIMRDGTVHDSIHEYTDYEDWMWNCPQPNYGG